MRPTPQVNCFDVFLVPICLLIILIWYMVWYTAYGAHDSHTRNHCMVLMPGWQTWRTSAMILRSRPWQKQRIRGRNLAARGSRGAYIKMGSVLGPHVPLPHAGNGHFRLGSNWWQNVIASNGWMMLLYDISIHYHKHCTTRDGNDNNDINRSNRLQ